jgi:hypothetical protein
MCPRHASATMASVNRRLTTVSQGGAVTATSYTKSLPASMKLLGD